MEKIKEFQILFKTVEYRINIYLCLCQEILNCFADPLSLTIINYSNSLRQ